MSNKIRKKISFLLIMFVIILASFGYLGKDVYSRNKGNKVFNRKINSISAWVVYWSLDVDKEIKALNSQLSSISYFAANFDYYNDIVIPEKLISYYNKTKSDKYIKYLTIVNDKMQKDGSFKLKDKGLIKELLDNSDTRSKHIDSIITLAKKYNFNGIEIDYEQIKGDIGLWNNYITFISKLYERCEDEDLKLRVVLETNTPFEKLSFPQGPTYVLMCYNLHGEFSKPGAKATPNFIKNSVEKMNKVPGKIEIALATGGFDWESNGKIISLTENQARTLKEKYHAEKVRDYESKCIVFKYKDEKDIEHEVWYADKVTLSNWMNIAEEKGYGVSIWRLAGNSFE